MGIGEEVTNPVLVKKASIVYSIIPALCTACHKKLHIYNLHNSLLINLIKYDNEECKNNQSAVQTVF